MNQEKLANNEQTKRRLENILDELFFLEEKIQQVRNHVRSAQRGALFDSGYVFEKLHKARSTIDNCHMNTTAIRNEFLGVQYCELCEKMISEDPTGEKHLLEHGIHPADRDNYLDQKAERDTLKSLGVDL